MHSGKVTFHTRVSLTKTDTLHTYACSKRSDVCLSQQESLVYSYFIFCCCHENIAHMLKKLKMSEMIQIKALCHSLRFKIIWKKKLYHLCYIFMANMICEVMVGKPFGTPCRYIPYPIFFTLTTSFLLTRSPFCRELAYISRFTFSFCVRTPLPIYCYVNCSIIYIYLTYIYRLHKRIL